MARIAALESLARKHVGDGKSDLVFVTVEGSVVAVFVGRKDFLDEAKDLADSFDGFAASVEDKDGVYYDNKEAERLQFEEDD
jgi:hypothetical protein